MKKLTFKQWYAIVVLVVFIVYGGLYLIKNRYKDMGGRALFDTWTSKAYFDLYKFAE